MARPPGTYDALRGGQTDQPDYNSLKVEHAAAPEVAEAVQSEPTRPEFKPREQHGTLKLGDAEIPNPSSPDHQKAAALEAERAQMRADLDDRTPDSMKQSPEERAATIEAQQAAAKDDLEKDER